MDIITEANTLLIIGLFAVAVFAGIIDAIAGGGGLITVPVLLAVGLSPEVALGTNKLQSSGGSFASSLYFWRKDMIDMRFLRPCILMTFIGAICGSWLLLSIETRVLQFVIPTLLIVMAGYFLFSSFKNINNQKPVISATTFTLLIPVAIGFYDGFFGPGTGALFALCFNFLLGFELKKATAHTKILNFTSNFSALLFFISFGKVVWAIGAIMILGQFIGSTIGAKLVLKKGANLIRPLTVFVCVSIAFKYIVEEF